MNVLPVLGGAAVAAFSAYMLAHAVRNYRSALASERWPTVDGRLHEVRLWGTRNIGGEMKAVEHLGVDYEYRVDGATHAGRTVSFYTLKYPETTDFAERHPPGSDVPVHYDPARPARSVLIRGPRKSQPYSDMIIGSLGLLVGIAVATAAWLGVIG